MLYVSERPSFILGLCSVHSVLYRCYPQVFQFDSANTNLFWFFFFFLVIMSYHQFSCRCCIYIYNLKPFMGLCSVHLGLYRCYPQVMFLSWDFAFMQIKNLVLVYIFDQILPSSLVPPSCLVSRWGVCCRFFWITFWHPHSRFFSFWFSGWNKWLV